MDLNRLFETLKTAGSVTPGEAWSQGRSLFGGLTAALMLAKLQHILDSPRRLRSLTVYFVGPVDAREPVYLEARILRVGKSVLQGEVHLLQEGGVRAVLLAAYGEARHSAARHTTLLPAPQWQPPQNLSRKQDLNGLELPFLRDLDLRWAEGAEAFSGAEQASFGAYTRLRNQSGAFTLPHLLVLADGFPPAPSVLLNRIAPMSSLTWTLELLHELENISMDDFWQYRVETDHAAEGYGHTEAKMWDAHGNLTLISRQTVTVFG
ncbi:acyl-CoA thioesterase [Bergeriella denitrificans]|uniref:Acyl-CoA thioesterase II n=1 Tax=Bergeriella denitrificans TaxID=494 RepID=A0A378UH05_BERDE|nr:thioesterase family protein [Bergeriella denitrificans]STZ76596.1 acyl-CoA thioesterase II [Bergeriella denitrificans]